MDTGIIRATEDEACNSTPAGRPGKLSIAPTKPLTTSAILRSPILRVWRSRVCTSNAQPGTAFDYTSKGNFVAVISNGTAVLGLGDLGALAASR